MGIKNKINITIRKRSWGPRIISIIIGLLGLVYSLPAAASYLPFNTSVNMNVGIGTSTPQSAFVVTNGNVGIGTWTAAGGNLIVNGGGNVGIGTAWPGQKLDVNGTVRTTGFAMSGQTPISGYVLTASDSAGDTTWTSAGTVSGWTVSGNDVYETLSGNVGIGTDTTNQGALVVTNGNVGIGTWAPTAPLTIGANAFTVNSNGAIATSGGYTQSGTGVNAFTGNVGLGSTNPGQVLDVQGTVRTTGFAMSGQTPISGYVLTASDSAGDTTWASLALVGGWTVSGNNVYETGSGNVGIGTSALQTALAITNGNVGIGTWTAAGGNLIVNGGGNVGIGTVWPGTTLDVNGSIRTTTTGGIIFGTDNKAIIQPSAATTPDLKFLTNNTEIMRITNGGNIGIGTTTPQTKLAIMGGNVGIGTWTAAGGNLIVNGGGNVGISTAWPGQALDVQGTVRTTGFAMSGQTPISGYVLTASDSAGDATWASLALVGGWTVSGNNVYETGSGNVGIGTSALQTALAITNGNVGIGTWTAAGGSLIINGGGNVGIGTVWPGQALDVNGTVRSTGFINTGGYTQIGLAANTITGTSTFSNAAYSALFTGGNVGVGSAAPGQALDVNGTVRTMGFTMSGQTPISGYVLTASDSTGDTTWTSPADVSGWTVSGNDVYETSSGNVGIGTSALQTALAITNGNVGIGTWTAAGGNLIVNGGGNVGIGTVWPGMMLDVNGGMRVSANIEQGKAVASGIGGNSTALGEAGGLGTITSSGTGSIAAGYSQVNGGVGASIISNTSGSLAFGHVLDLGGTPATITSSGDGAVAIGLANNGTLSSIGSASIAMGYANTGTLQSTGLASVAMGENVQATANNAFALGLSVVNPNASSFMVGFNATPTLTVTGTGVGIGTSSPFGGSLIVASGNVGIGSLAPGQALDVNGTVRTTGFAMSGQTPLSGYVLTASDSAGDTTWTTPGDVSGWTISGNNVYETSSGNVGIGTSALQTALAITNGNVGIGTWTAAGGNLIVNGGGNVGIGSAWPGQALDVNGTVRMTGFILNSSPVSGDILMSNGIGIGTWIAASAVATPTPPGGIGTELQYRNGANFAAVTNSAVSVSGNVGLGTTLSANKLDVNGGVGIGTAYAGYFIAPANGLIVQGNVGVGSTAPGQALDVNGTVRTTGFTMSGQTPISGYVLTASDSAGDTTWTSAGTVSGWTVSGNNVYETLSGNVGIGTFALQTALAITNGNVGIGTWTAAGGNLIVDGGGNVGIGTIWPGQALDVNGTVRSIGFIATGSYTQIGISANTFSGNVGVGSTAPGQALDVNGTVRSIGFITTGGYTQIGLSANTITGTSTFSNAAYSALFTGGNVGVGSAAPGQELDVQGTVRTTGFAMSGQTPVSGYVLTASDSAGDATWASASAVVGWTVSGNNVFETSNGNVGIGTSALQTALAITNGNVGIGTWTAAGGNLIVNGGGNVGIGTAWPGVTLDVNGTVRTTSLTLSGQTPVSGYVLTASDSAGDTTWSSLGAAGGWTVSGNNVYETSSGNVGIGTSALQTALAITNGNVGIGTWTAAGGNLIVNGGGNVGIGTVWPGQALDVNGTVRSTGIINTGGYTQIGLSANTITGTSTFSNAAYSALFTGGNVGVGSAAPGQALDVNGTVRTTGFAMSGQTPISGYILTASDSTGDTTWTTPGDVSGWTVSGNNVYETSSGNVGIGTSALQTALAITNGNVGIGTWTAAGGNLIVNGGGNVGIGSVWPGQALDVNGTTRMTGFILNNNPVSGDILMTNGIGIGTWIPASAVATPTPPGGTGTELQYRNGANFAAVTNSAVNLSGNVGLGTTLSANRLDVQGGVGIGTAYAGYIAAPINGLIVQGNVGVGSAAPGQALDVNGTVRTTGFAMSGQTPLSGYVLTASDSAGDTTWTTPGDVSGWTISGNNVYETSSGNVGIGTFALQTALAITNGNVGIGTWTAAGGSLIVASGNVGIGSAWPGTALDVEGTMRGLSGLELGGALASGGNSSALGFVTGGGTIVSSGSGSLAAGYSEKDVGNSSIAATNRGSLAIGATLSAGGNASLSATNQGGVALGYAFSSVGNATVLSSGSGAIAAGNANAIGGATTISATGDSAIAMGLATTGNILSSGNASVAMGYANNGTLQATGDGSVAMGQNVQATANNAFALGLSVVNPNASSFMVGFNPAPTLTVTGTGVGIGTSSPFGGGLIVLPAATGNVGIGSLTPGQALDVQGTVRTVAFTMSGQTPISGYVLTASDSAGDTTWTTPGDVAGWTVSGNNVYETSSGNVGIGTFALQTALAITNGNVGIGTWTAAGGSLIVASGNVGIGTAWPGALMDVNGTVRFLSGIEQGGAIASAIDAIALGQTMSGGTITSTGSGGIAGGFSQVTGGGTGANITSNGSGNIAFGKVQSTLSSSGLLSSTGTGSVALGYAVEAGTATSILSNGFGTIAMGVADNGTILSSGNGAVAMGEALNGFLQATGIGSVAMGQNVQANASNNFALGRNVINPNASSFMVGFNATPTLTVTGTGVGIGTSSPFGGSLIVASGNVGIGSLAPGQALDVNGTVRTTGFTMSGQTPISGYILTASDSAGDTTWTTPGDVGGWTVSGNNVYETSSGNVGIGTSALQTALAITNGNVGIGTWTAAGGNLIVNGGGNVGIGSAWPGTTVDVQGTVRALYFVGNGTGLTGISGAISGLTPGRVPRSLNSTTIQDGTMFDNGNIGIGSITPGQLLDVQGTVRTTGFTMSGQTPISGYILTASDSAGDTTWTTPGDVGGWTVSGNNVYETSSGNVGIGTSALQTALAITNGNVGIGTWTAAGGNLIVNGGGNVGIGSAWPGQKMDVQGTVRTTGFAMSGQTPISGYVLTASDSTGDTTWTTPGDIGGWTVSGNNVYETSSGNVGIGTSALQTALAITNGNVGIGTWTAAGGNLIINGGGNVGIGTAWPGQALDIQGSLRVSGTEYVGSDIALINVGDNHVGMTSTSSRASFGGTNASATIFGAYMQMMGANYNAGSTITSDGGAEFVIDSANNATQFNILDYNGVSWSQPLFMVSSTGNVGIGTSVPKGALDIKTGNNVLVESGNVGIGSLVPGQALDVSGTVRMMGLTLSNNGAANGNVLVTNSVGIGTWMAVSTLGAGTPTGGGLNAVQYNSPLGAFNGNEAALSFNGTNVGVGTTNALNSSLEILKSGSTALFKIESTVAKNGNYLTVDNNGNVGIGTNNTSGAGLTVMNGNVGISTVTPGQVLDVNGTVRTTGFAMSGQTPISGYVLTASDSAGDTTWTTPGDVAGWTVSGNNVYETSSGNVGIGTFALQTALAITNGNVGIGTWTAAGGSLIIKGGGNVGIGSAWPGQLLDLQGNIRDLGEIVNGNVGIGTSALQTAFAVTNGNVGIGTWTAAGGSLIVASGNVGIGSAWPGTALDVLGTMRFSGNIEQGGAVASGTNAIALGWVSGGGTITSSNFGTFAQGIADNIGGTSAGILSSGNGSIAEGDVQSTFNTSSIVASSTGALAIGFSSSTASASTITANNIASFAMGLASNGTLGSSGFGSFAMGYANSGTLEATGNASFAMGQNVQANASNDFALGVNVVNPNASSFMVGFNPTPTLTVTGTGVGIGTSSPFGGSLIVASGNVGIGSLTPGQALDVNGTVRTTSFAMTGQTPISGYVLTASDSAGDTTWTTPGDVAGWTVSGNNVYETSSGNVGIGTFALQTALAITNGNVGIGTWTAAGGSLIVASGNVGIGSAWPGSALDVQGTVRVGGFSEIGTQAGLGEISLGQTSDGGTIVATSQGGALAGGNADNFSGTSASITSEGPGSFAYGESFSSGGGSTSVIFSNNSGSIAMGDVNNGEIASESSGSVAIGYASTGTLISSSSGSIAMGLAFSGTLESTGQGSVALGQNVQANANNAFALGLSVVNPNTNSFMVGFNPTPTLTVTGTGVGIGTSSPFGGGLIVLPAATGNVGIGSLTPGQALDVQGTARMTGFDLTNNGASNGYVMVTNNIGVGTWMPVSTLPIGAGSNYWQLTSAPGNVGISTVYSVGIGTTFAGAGAGLLVMNGNVGIGTWAPQGALDIKTGGNVLVESGNVGIGTYVPSASLDVSGNSILGEEATNADSITSNGGGALAGGLAGHLVSGSGNIKSSGQGSFAYGDSLGIAGTANFISSSTGSIAMGYANNSTLQATGLASVAMGENVQANAANAFALGENVVNPTASSFMVGYSIIPALTVTNTTVGIGIGTYTTPSGGLDILGNVGIGTFNPFGGGLIVLPSTTGNVGIGSLTPGQALDVQGTVRTTAFAMSGQTPLSGYVLTASDSAGDTTWTTPGDVGGWTVSGNNVYETSSGNVGIGTFALQTALAVTNGNVGIGTWTAAGGSLIVATGNVGIGSAWPGTSLDIQGTLRFSQNIEQGGAVASGSNSLALGRTNGGATTSSSNGSFAGGYSWVNGGTSTSITASGNGSFVYGQATASTSTASMTASGAGSVVLGDATDAGLGAASISASQAGSIAMGFAGDGTILSSGTGSIAMGGVSIGGLLQATGTVSVAIGQNVQATANNALALGLSVVNPNTQSFMVGFNPTPTLTVTGTGVGIGTSSPFGGGLIVLPAATGNVGIGSLTPGQALDVQGTVRMTGLTLTGNGANNGYVMVTNNIGVGTWMPVSTLPIGAGSNYWQLTSAPGNVGISTVYSVGIGTTFGGTGTGLIVMNGNVGIGTWEPAGALDIKTGNNVLVETGNLGIGSLTPGTALDVQGTMRFSQSIEQGGAVASGPNAAAFGNVSTGTMTSSGSGSLVFGHTSGTLPSITSTGSGSLSGGSSLSIGANSTITSSGGFAYGSTISFPGETATITSSSPSNSSIAMGLAEGIAGHVASITSSQDGTIAMGDAVGGVILSSIGGSIAMGFAGSGETLQATAQGAVAMGEAVQATASNSLAFGLSVVNPNASSFMVGFNATPTLTVTGTGVGIGTSSPFGGGLIVLPSATGNVGIGSLTPGQALDVQGTVRTTSFAMSGQTPVSGYVLTASDSAGDTTWTTPGDVGGWTVTGNNVYETSSGNVGIGTSALQTALAITNGNVGIGTWTAAGGNLIINGGGNVGIGSAWPGQLLDVQGTVRATAFAEFGTIAGQNDVSFGQTQGGATITAFNQGGALAGGNAFIVGGVSATIASDGPASFAYGDAGSTAGGNGAIISSNIGSIAMGDASNGTISSSDSASVAIGYASSGSLLSNGQGSVAMGDAIGGTLQATGVASFALGQNVQATAANAFAFGLSVVNPNASSLMVGFNATPTMTVTGTGVGIGTSSPFGGGLIVLPAATGNVGIGSLTPGQALDVQGTVRMTGLTLTGNGANNGYVMVTNNIGVGTWMPVSTLPIGAGSNYWQLTSAPGNVGISTTNTVGIGTTAAGAGAGLLVMNGNVGIGTWVPGRALDVQGTIRSSNGLETGPLGVNASNQSIAMGQAASGGTITASAFSFAGGHALNSGAPAAIQATGDSSMAFGNVETITGVGSITASTFGSVAMGVVVNQGNITSSGQGALAMGRINMGSITASGEASVAMGDTGVGLGAITSSGSGSIALGYGGGTLQATGQGSIAIGDSVQANATDAEAFGSSIINNIPSTFMVGFNTTPTLTVTGTNVGIGTFNPFGGKLIVMGGNIGIGSLTPGQALDVNGTVRTTGFAMSGQTPISGYVLTASDSAGDTTWTSGGDVSGWTVVGNNVYETSSGNVGIGTSALQTALAITNGNVGIGTWTAAGGNLIIKGGGNVGIGTSWPGAMLDVNGTARFLTGIEQGGAVASGTNSLALGNTSFGGTITSAGLGSLAGGSAQIGGGATSGTISVTSGSAGAFAYGFSLGNGAGNSSIISATSEGSIAMGWTQNGTILSSGDGSIAMGFANGNTLQATGNGSVAMGDNVQATALDAEAFGQGVNNNTASTIMMGFGTTPTLTVTSANVGIGTFNPFGGKLIVTSGNVGIGSLAPGQALDVTGTVRMTGFALPNNGASAGNIMVTNGVGVGTWMSVNTLGVTGSNYWSLAGGPGNVGINTTNSVGIGTTAGVGAGLVVMNGNVGIGTWVPQVGLDVQGTIRSLQNIEQGGAVASGTNNATALGNATGGGTITSSGQGSFAGGYTVIAGGTGASILSSGSGSLAMGEANSGGLTATISATSAGSVALGYAQSSGGLTTAITSSGLGSIAMGYSILNVLQATGQASVALGQDVQANASNTFALGSNVRNNFASSFMVGFLNNNPTLTVTSTGVGIGTWVPLGGGLIVIPANTGNVGIGSMTPGQALDVNGTVRTTAFAMSGQTPISGYVMTASDSAGDTTWTTPGDVGGWTVTGNNVYETSFGNVGIGTLNPFGGSLIVKGGGNVGIGTLVPGQLLDVQGTVRALGAIINGNVGIGTFFGNASLAVMNGNVGIGTWSGLNTFDVKGGIAAGAYAGLNIAPVNGMIISGNVGIGTINAEGALQVRAGVDENGFFQNNQNLSDGVAFSSVNDLNSANKGLELRGSIVQLTASGPNPIYFLTNNSGNSESTVRETIDKNGNIGIGTVGSGGVLNQRLTVVGNIGVGISGPPADLFTNSAPPNGGMIIEGNVGIGSAAPGQKLDVQGTVRTTGFAMSGQTPISGYVLTASDSAGDTTWTSAGAVSGWTVSGSNVYETSSGNVGIGTSALQTALAITNGNVGIGTWTAAGGNLIVIGGGNVGIGSAWPGQVLDVQGTARMSGNVGIGSSITDSSGSARLTITATTVEVNLQ